MIHTSLSLCHIVIVFEITLISSLLFRLRSAVEIEAFDGSIKLGLMIHWAGIMPGFVMHVNWAVLRLKYWYSLWSELLAHF